MSKKAQRERLGAQNRQWMQDERQRRREASAAAALQRKPVDGLTTTNLPSIADQLDEVDPKVRGMTGARPVPPPFVPPRFVPSLVNEKKESQSMFTSAQRVRPKKMGVPGGKSNHVRIILPHDIIEAIGFSKLLEMDFDVELTDDGILFRPAGTRQVALPSWAAGSPESFRKAAGR